MKILLANPRGFCAGVDRAIDIVEHALESFGAPIYVRHEVVHNKHVVEDLRNKGAVFTDELDEIPDHSTVIFSAHGVSQSVRQESKARNFKVFDATCPLVTKVHFEVVRYSRQGVEVILIGHKNHPEVEGTMGQYDNPEGGIYLVENIDDVKNLQVKNPDSLGFVTQTTLSVDDTLAIIDALKERYPSIKGPRREDICYATQNRQDAVKRLAEQSDLVLVVGSKSSSNSNRLRELAERLGCPSYLVDNADEIDYQWIKDKQIIGVTAGASAPEILVENVVKRLKEWGATMSEELIGQEETIVFALPREMRDQ